MNAGILAGFAAMWALLIWGFLALLHYRRRTVEASTTLHERLDQDAPLAAWCRRMRLTVVTHTGWEFTMTLAEIHESEAPDVREWNLPIRVVLEDDIERNGVPLLEAAPLRTGES
jgi:hypothetical protein